MKHLLKLSDCSKDEILDILNLADQLKYEQKHGIAHKRLEGQTLGMIFQKSSTLSLIHISFGTGKSPDTAMPPLRSSTLYWENCKKKLPGTPFRYTKTKWEK